jgi:ligand-binding SRPBCC domain-containing protein
VSRRLHVYEREQTVCHPLAETFGFFAEAGNLERITPPWLSFRILTEPDRMAVDAVISYRLILHHVPLRWTTRIEAWDPPRRFVDLQVSGPYAVWEHTHSFEAVAGGTRICDRVRYRQRFGLLGAAAERLFARRDIERIFDYRARALPRLLAEIEPR